jgi:GTP-binding protein YchF
VDGSVDAVRDVETVNTELVLADLETIERRRLKHKRGMSIEEIRFQQTVLGKLEAALQEGKPASTATLVWPEQELAAGLFLLTMKPMLYVANVDETDMLTEGPQLAHLREWARSNGQSVISIAARLEAEVAELAENDATDFVEEYGLPELGLGRVVHMAYATLDLITFFTAVGKECRAWTLERGSRAVDAAGKIHTDMEKGFQKAEVIAFDDLAPIGSWSAARDNGQVRMEGREYIVNDGDVMQFRFST